MVVRPGRLSRMWLSGVSFRVVYAFSWVLNGRLVSCFHDAHLAELMCVLLHPYCAQRDLVQPDL
jgi:hypothetical protein